MNKSGPIIVIEDGDDDQQILPTILHELHLENKILVFEDGIKAVAYFKCSLFC